MAAGARRADRIDWATATGVRFPGGSRRSVPRPPVDRFYLEPRELASDAAVAAPQPAAPAARPPTPVIDTIDLDQLDRDLWKRFEKRIRVEHERRGRG